MLLRPSLQRLNRNVIRDDVMFEVKYRFKFIPFKCLESLKATHLLEILRLDIMTIMLSISIFLEQ